jgi:hypothetical protein
LPFLRWRDRFFPSRSNAAVAPPVAIPESALATLPSSLGDVQRAPKVTPER